MKLIKVVSRKCNSIYVNKKYIIQIEVIDNYEVCLYVKEQQPMNLYRKQNHELEQLLKQ